MEEKRGFNEKGMITKESSNAQSHELSMEKAVVTPATKNRKNFIITCAKFHDFDEKFNVKFHAWNDPDHKLISPINASINLAISCKIPKSFQIFLLKEDEPLLDFNNAKLQTFNTIYVKNMEAYEFQVWAFDVLNTAFYNFSSLEIKWTMTKHEEAFFENIT